MSRMMEKARLKHEQKCRDELQQPYIFRDKHLWAAENLLIFDDFYSRLMKAVAQIGIALHSVSSSVE